MNSYALYNLLICRSQTEAQNVRRCLAQAGIPGEVMQPPRGNETDSCSWAVRVASGQSEEAVRCLRRQGITLCKVIPDRKTRI